MLTYKKMDDIIRIRNTKTKQGDNKMKELEELLATKKIHKAMRALNNALKLIEEGNLRMGKGEIDFAEYHTIAAKSLIEAEIDNNEGGE